MTAPQKSFKAGPHDMLPTATHDEAGHLGFVRALRRLITSTLTPGPQPVFDARIGPKVEQRIGRPPKDRHEIRQDMEHDGYHQMWAAMLRTTQEMMWTSVLSSVNRQAGDLNDTYKTIHAQPKKASLRLNPDLDVPKYSKAVDYHTVPGGYHAGQDNMDASVGAAYDMSVHVYMMGGMGKYNDDVGKMLSAWVNYAHADLKPKRILDIGCSVGHSTLPYLEHYPDAEIHAIDLSASMLRYGFARAESLGKPIHFSQQNAEATDFEDDSFDLIVSHIMIHETS